MTAGLSQYALAKKAGISKQAMSQLELGQSEPVWSTVQKLALVLGVDCRAFADPDLALPEVEVKGRGRPSKPEELSPRRPRSRQRKDAGAK
jgi:transcriptional regulator with XRE-family HTH domain